MFVSLLDFSMSLLQLDHPLRNFSMSELPRLLFQIFKQQVEADTLGAPSEMFASNVVHVCFVKELLKGVNLRG